MNIKTHINSLFSPKTAFANGDQISSKENGIFSIESKANETSILKNDQVNF